MIEILTATENELPIVQRIANETWPDTFGSILSKAQIVYMIDQMYNLDSLAEQIHKKGHVFLLAKMGAEHVGYVSYELNHKSAAKTKIHKLYLLPSAQGQGIGKQLIWAVADIAKRNGSHALSLNVNRHNPAVQFYQKMGFAKIAEEKIPIGHGYWMDDVVMEMPLSSLSIEVV